MWIFDVFDLIDELVDLRYYQYAPGKWFLDKMLQLSTIGCVILAVVGGSQGMPVLLILGIVGAVVLGIAELCYHFWVVKEYHEFREAESAGNEALRKEREQYE
ncbi:MAG: hypothetical protein IJW45_06860 [Oscillospiraceae bacterium]|nr:hypothetical protein [Oscillospiraceae bacterium]